jgi:hypothetical protein
MTSKRKAWRWKLKHKQKEIFDFSINFHYFVTCVVKLLYLISHSCDSLYSRLPHGPTSFPSALQLRVSFGLLNNQPLFFDAMVDSCLGKRHFPLPVLPRSIIWFLYNLRSFYGVRMLASRPTPNLEDQGTLFVWLLPLDPSGMVGTTSSYATAGIALRVLGGLKPHHHHHRWGYGSTRQINCGISHNLGY